MPPQIFSFFQICKKYTKNKAVNNLVKSCSRNLISEGFDEIYVISKLNDVFSS